MKVWKGSLETWEILYRIISSYENWKSDFGQISKCQMWETLKRGTDQQCPFLGSERYILLFVKYIFIVCVFAHVRVYVVPSESRFSLFNMWVPWMEPCIVKDGLHQLSHLPSPNTGSFSMRVSKYFPWSVSRLADPPSNAKICWKRFSLWRVHLRAAP